MCQNSRQHIRQLGFRPNRYQVGQIVDSQYIGRTGLARPIGRWNSRQTAEKETPRRITTNMVCLIANDI
jgi:hypothetical protein